MYGRTWTRAGGELRALGNPPAVSPRLAVSIRSHALVVSRLVTSKSSHPAAQNHLPLPQPCLPNPWEINPLLVARENSRKLASAAFIPAIRPAIHTITHPHIPQFLRCPGRPMTQCYSSLGRPAHGCSGLGRGIRHREHKLPRTAAVYARLEAIQSSSPPRKRDKLATCPGSTLYFAPRDLPLVFFGPCGGQSPTSTLASCKCHLRAALPRQCTCTTLRCHCCGTYQPRPPFICPVLPSAASSVSLLV